ncbi:putative ABC transport system permease protein [Nakamurella sp. UYEF19]|uniref:hypothetical protein n=1 Tax=Nakamurella sp. UYEF19 TaxID=1756392 RepID=UPI0033911E5D
MTENHSVAVGLVGILRRHLRAARGPGVLLALLVFVCTTLVAALPGAIESRGAAELRYQVSDLGPTQRFLTTRVFAPLPRVSVSVPGFSPDVAAVWGGWDAALENVRDQAPEPLRQTLGRPVYTAVTTAFPLPRDAAVSANLQLSFAADPRLTDFARLVAGVWPAADHQAPASLSPVDVALSTETAKALGWKIGTVRRTVMRDGRVHPMILTGLFEAAAGSTDHWLLNGNIVHPSIVETPNTQIRTGVAYVHPASWPLAEAFTSKEQTQIYLRFDVSRIRSSDVPALRAQIDTFTAAAHPLTGLPGADPLRLSTRSGQTLRAVEASTAVARALLLVIAVGPCGAAVAVLLLASRLLVDRRRRALGLLSTRGWSTLRSRVALAAEGLLLSVPATLLAVATVLLIAPPDHRVDLVLPVAAGLLLVPSLLAAAATPSNSPGARADYAPRRSRRRRWVAEVVLLGAAVASVALLFAAGASPAAGGVDPLIVGAPLLLCLASAVAVTRVYPWPLRGLLRSFRRRRGVVNFLGSARAVREPASGVAPVFALVVGVGTAVLSSILLSTLSQGVNSAARSDVGADLRVAAARLSPAALARVRALPVVVAAATSMTVDPVQIAVSGTEQAMSVYLVDAGELRSVQAGVTGAASIPDSVVTPGPANQVVISADLAAQLAQLPARALAVGDHALTVADVSASAAGLGRSSTWILADRSMLSDFTDSAYEPDTLLLELTPDADPASAATAVDGAIQGEGAVIAPQQVSATLLAAPAIGGVQAMVLITLISVAALGALAVTLLSVGSAPARRRLLGVLGILGLPPGAGRRLVGWELIPMALAALLGGGAVGVGLSRMVLSAIDLRPFTGGPAGPSLAVDPVVMIMLVGGYVVVVALATVLGAAIAEKAAAAVVVRFGET